MNSVNPKEYPLHIDSPAGRLMVPAVHKVVLREGELQCATVALRLNGTAYVGHGDDTGYALYDLAKQLPEGCTLRCCLTCRHGHFCPVGDQDNELFCVTDFEPKQKADLYHITEDEGERAKRRRHLFHVCGDFEPMSDAYYTYK